MSWASTTFFNIPDRNESMTEIVCKGKDGRYRQFIVNGPMEDSNPKGRELRFTVSTEDPSKAEGEVFELVLLEKKDGNFQSIWIGNSVATVYRAVGIPHELLPLVARTIGKRICSGPSGTSESGVWRTKEATEMWQRLTDSGRATYESEEDVYCTVEPINT